MMMEIDSLEHALKMDVKQGKGFTYFILSNDIEEDLYKFVELYSQAVEKPASLKFLGNSDSMFSHVISYMKPSNISNEIEPTDIFITNDIYLNHHFNEMFFIEQHLIILIFKTIPERKIIDYLKMTGETFKIIVLTGEQDACFGGNERTYSWNHFAGKFIKLRSQPEPSMNSFLEGFEELKELVNDIVEKKPGNEEKDKCDGCGYVLQCGSDDSFRCVKE